MPTLPVVSSAMPTVLRRSGISRTHSATGRTATVRTSAVRAGPTGRRGRVRVMRTVAVVLAGGSGQRFGSGLPKQLLPLTGRTLLEHSVAAFEEAPDVDAILVVMAAGHAT